MIDALEGTTAGVIAEYTSPLSNAIPTNSSDVVSLSPLAQAKILEQQGKTSAEIADQSGVGNDAPDGDFAIEMINVQTKAATNNT